MFTAAIPNFGYLQKGVEPRGTEQKNRGDRKSFKEQRLEGYQEERGVPVVAVTPTLAV
jgi:hypothetical protein